MLKLQNLMEIKGKQNAVGRGLASKEFLLTEF